MAVLTADKVADFFEHGAPVKLDVKVAPRFKPGDRIVGKNIHPKGHCRLPRYVRGKRGEIVEDHGVLDLRRHQRLWPEPKAAAPLHRALHP